MKNIVIIVVAILVIGGAAVALTRHNDTKTQTVTNGTTMHMNNGTPATSTKSDAASSTPTATSAVTIENFAFSPANITVKKGTTVTWTNKDSTAHTVTETDGKTGPKSGSLSKGDTYSFTFNTTGSFAYVCSFHSNMTASITVTE